MADSVGALQTAQRHSAIYSHILRLRPDLALTVMIATYAYILQNNQANAQKIRSRQKQAAWI